MSLSSGKHHGMSDWKITLIDQAESVVFLAV